MLLDGFIVLKPVKSFENVHQLYILWVESFSSLTTNIMFPNAHKEVKLGVNFGQILSPCSPVKVSPAF